MPELPEVETVRKIVKAKVMGKKVVEVIVKKEKFVKNIDVNEFIAQLEGQKITDVRRYGKYLFLDFEDNTLVSHLRMEGKYNFYNTDYEDEKHDYIIFKFEDQSVLKYNDSRQFGTMELVEYQNENSLKGVAKLGLEPFDENLNYQYLIDKLKKRNPEIKKLLLDQTFITGLGNIYVDEVLYKCNIHPLTKVKYLTEQEITNIIENSIIILGNSIKLGGTTVKSFSVSGDVSGGFQYSLNVYGKQGEECPKCLTKFEKIKVGGRGTCFCPNCQREKNENSN